MKLILISLVAVTLPVLVMANLVDNQITDDNHGIRMPFTYSRPSRARGYAVRSCRECAPNECQVMGMQRYSEPRCEAFGGLGSPCRMWQEPENKTLNFPNEILYCDNVYMQFCPCARGLVCDQAVCKKKPHGQQARPVVNLPSALTAQRTRQQQQQQEQLERESESDGFDVMEGVVGGGLDLHQEENEDNDAMPIAFEPARSKFPWAVARFH